MDNQHKKIKGYRDLSQEEIDLMNRIKEHAEKTAALIAEVNTMRDNGQKHDLYGVPFDRTDGLTKAQASESYRCLALAKTNLQTGQMWFVRAVALPDSF
ncbi:hypothetical protein VPHD85_0003 [Vibrio phage D85]|nr:hypothetical protein PODOV033v1_p0063 [Vibrio phage 252E42.2]